MMFHTCMIVFILVAIESELNRAELIKQTFLIESPKRDIGTTYVMSINPELETMTLTMTGPDDIWMGVTVGSETMFNVTAYIYFLEDNEWVFEERYLTGETDAGELIEIIDENNYNIIKQNGITKIIFTRPWVSTHLKSFTLLNTDTEFHYGFARGTSGILAYHQHEGRSHSVYILQHSVGDNYKGVESISTHNSAQNATFLTQWYGHTIIAILCFFFGGCVVGLIWLIHSRSKLEKTDGELIHKQHSIVSMEIDDDKNENDVGDDTLLKTN